MIPEALKQYEIKEKTYRVSELLCQLYRGWHTTYAV